MNKISLFNNATAVCYLMNELKESELRRSALVRVRNKLKTVSLELEEVITREDQIMEHCYSQIAEYLRV